MYRRGRRGGRGVAGVHGDGGADPLRGRERDLHRHHRLQLAGVNINYGDTARFSGITVVNDPSRAMVICRKWIGNNSGDEPDDVGSGADNINCFYSPSDITYR